jgi:hypothetical protein
MSYNCSAVISIEVDGVSLYDMFREIKKHHRDKENTNNEEYNKLKNILDKFLIVQKELSNKKIRLNLNHSDEMFLNDVRDEMKWISGGLFEKTSYIDRGTSFNEDGSYKSRYHINPYIFESDNYADDPLIILDTLIFTYFYSLELPEKSIDVGIGDAGYFWMDISLSKGAIKALKAEFSENPEEDQGTYGFTCSENEIKHLFKELENTRKLTH